MSEEAYLLADAANAYGQAGARFRRAKPAQSPLPVTLRTAMDAIKDDPTMGYISKALCYSRLLAHNPRLQTNIARLLKGGFLRIVLVEGAPPQGTNAHRDSPSGNRYYRMEATR